MSILDLYNNPENAVNPNAARQIRFKDNESDALSDKFTPYRVNDQASLRESELHSEGVTGDKQLGYSVDGTPASLRKNYNNERYFAVGQIPSQIASNQVINVSENGHTQNYNSGRGYTDDAFINSLLEQNLTNEVFALTGNTKAILNSLQQNEG
jgi:hypothetical protein